VPPASAAAFAAAAPAASPQPAARPERRTVKSAKLITAGETATHMKLGADGELPQLMLREGEQGEKKAEEKQGMSPLVLVALLVSVAASVGLLFIPTDDVQSESRNKRTARNLIEQHYTTTIVPIDTKSPNKPYQYYLGLALQAHNKGDFKAEQRYYRDVLNLLKSEGKSEAGLTGRLGPSGILPNDHHLETQLEILLGN
jgi:hypothetical protein